MEAAPELDHLVLVEAGGEVHGHAVLDASGEEGVELLGQGTTAVRLRAGRELERLGSRRTMQSALMARTMMTRCGMTSVRRAVRG